MLRLIRTIQEHDPDNLSHRLKQELETGAGTALPLDKGTSEGGYCDPGDLRVTVLDIVQDEATIHARIGVFFTEIVANCGCGDEPMEKPAYCQMTLTIDRATGGTRACIIADE